MDLDEKHVFGTHIYECVQFGADPNINLDLVDLNVVFLKDIGHKGAVGGGTSSTVPFLF